MRSKKKVIGALLLGTALLALNAVASEVQVKGGYDFYRKYKAGSNAVDNDFTVKHGPTLGLEYIVDNQGEFEWGLEIGRASCRERVCLYV